MISFDRKIRKEWTNERGTRPSYASNMQVPETHNQPIGSQEFLHVPTHMFIH